MVLAWQQQTMRKVVGVFFKVRTLCMHINYSAQFNNQHIQLFLDHI